MFDLCDFHLCNVFQDLNPVVKRDPPAYMIPECTYNTCYHILLVECNNRIALSNFTFLLDLTLSLLFLHFNKVVGCDYFDSGTTFRCFLLSDFLEILGIGKEQNVRHLSASKARFLN